MGMSSTFNLRDVWMSLLCLFYFSDDYDDMDGWG
uniref:Uncharacterized protein n=1 Tax=Shewanella putrefaciens (strain 200) TaxID=399804 RepID=E6XFQ9_SHEP2